MSMGFEFEDGQKTIHVRYRIDDLYIDYDEDMYDYSDESIDNIISFLNEIAETNVFLDGILKRMKELGYSGSDEVSTKKEFLIKQFQDNKVLNKDGDIAVSSVTISNWLSGKTVPRDDVTNRPNVFALCFALNFDLKETANFFYKCYLQKPFNYRDDMECVYYYCLNNHLPYSYAEELMQKVADINPDETDGDIDKSFTYNVQNRIDNIHEEEELISFLTFNYYSMNKVSFDEELSVLTQDNYGTIRELEELKEECIECLKKYREKTNYYDDKEPIGIESVINDIYDGFEDFMNDDEFDKYNGSLSKIKAIPDKIKKNIPAKKTIHNLFQEKKPKKLDTMRKAIILLTFYSFYMGLRNRDEKNTGANKESFLVELNDRLYKCGYIGVYPYNPYDSLILICANQDDPILSLQCIIGNYIKKEYEE